MKSRLLWMLVTGFCLALVLLLAVQITQTLRNNHDNPVATATAVEDLNETTKPVVFKTISETGNVLTLSGTSEPNAVVAVQSQDAVLAETKADEDGVWNADITVGPQQKLVIELVARLEESVNIRSDETVFRIPAPRTYLEDELLAPRPPALIMVTAPGGPSRLIQSPFRGVPMDGPLSLGPIDYDGAGSVILSGSSEAVGQVRIYANDVFVGASLVGPDGRWFLIALETLPVGSSEIKAVLKRADDILAEVIVPFERLGAADTTIDERVDVSYEPYRWQITRNLYGGGQQYTSIFAPIEADPIILEE